MACPLQKWYSQTWTISSIPQSENTVLLTVNWLSFSQEVGLTHPMHSHYSQWTMVYEKRWESWVFNTALSTVHENECGRYQLLSQSICKELKGLVGGGLYPRRKENRSRGTKAVAAQTQKQSHTEANGQEKEGETKPFRSGAKASEWGRKGAGVGRAEWSL